MYGIISNNPERQAEIKRIVKDKGNIIYENITENIALALKEIGRVNVQTVVIDVNDVFEDDFIAGIKNFKVARPAARIILITPGRTPGDKILSQAVAKGIYDIVSDISGLEEAVENKASYADAVRWDVESVRQGKEEEKEPQYIERVVSRVANLWFSIKKPEDNVWASQQEARVNLPEVKTKLQKIISDISLKFAKTKKKTKGAAVIVVWNSSGQHMVSVALELAMIASGTLVNFNFDNPELDSWFGVKH
ncbi:hypothetical protein LR013_05485, partial [candidate division NPL-UPA2 bacterium]|nr:hypothetical protein [candidate division NPL-UPA2 bacterium]